MDSRQAKMEQDEAKKRPEDPPTKMDIPHTRQISDFVEVWVLGSMLKGFGTDVSDKSDRLKAKKNANVALVRGKMNGFSRNWCKVEGQERPKRGQDGST